MDEGAPLGAEVGEADGVALGAELRAALGAEVGEADGAPLGAGLGAPLGALLGEAVALTPHLPLLFWQF